MSGAPPPSYSGKRSRLYMCLYFPEWSIDVTRRKLLAQHNDLRSDFIILSTEHGHHTVVSRACLKAQRAGVKASMTLQLARALLPNSGVYCEPFDPLRDFEALRTLAAWCLRFSPFAGVDSELHNAQIGNHLSGVSPLYYGIVIDLSGTQRLYRNFQAFAHSLRELFNNTARVAIAPTIGGAWALSRYTASPSIVSLSIPALQDSTDDLPVEALRLPQTSCDILHEVGVHTIEQLREIPRYMLADRFGKIVVYRLSQFLGSVEETIHVTAPRKQFIQRKIFEPPLVHRHAITVSIQGLFAALIASLQRSCIIAKLFKITLRDTTGVAIHKELPLASATNDKQHLTAIIQPIIDSMQFCGELREILIEASQTARHSYGQHSFGSCCSHSSIEDQTRAHKELLNTFSVRIGKDQISYAHLTNSFIPERSFTYQSALHEFSGNDRNTLGEVATVYGMLERPPVLFAKPEDITTIAMLPDRPPSRLTWRGATLAIISGNGPERIAPEWWRGDLQRDTFSERDYFTVQDQSGRWLWIFRDNTSLRWFIHGVWT